jgi:hypothetical protein
MNNAAEKRIRGIQGMVLDVMRRHAVGRDRAVGPVEVMHHAHEMFPDAKSDLSMERIRSALTHSFHHKVEGLCRFQAATTGARYIYYWAPGVTNDERTPLQKLDEVQAALELALQEVHNMRPLVERALRIAEIMEGKA